MYVPGALSDMNTPDSLLEILGSSLYPQGEDPAESQEPVVEEDLWPTNPVYRAGGRKKKPKKLFPFSLFRPPG